MNEINNWKSIRRYQDKTIEKEKIDAILNAGRRAPSWQNLQPWHFIVITQPELKDKLSEIIITDKLVKKAPIVIAVLGYYDGFKIEHAKAKMKELIGSRMNDKELDTYLHDKMASPLLGGENILLARVLEQVSYATAFMILEASHLGLGSCIVGGIENSLTKLTKKHDEVKKELNIPDNYEILSLVTLGYPNENPDLRNRKDFNETVSFEKF